MKALAFGTIYLGYLGSTKYSVQLSGSPVEFPKHAIL
jgi:hypothetical protein